MNRILLLLCLVLVMSACSNTKTETKTGAAAAAAQPAGDIVYPSVTAPEMQVLVQKTTLIDFIFYNENFSMNLTDKGAIINALRQVGEAPGLIQKQCKPTGRVIYQGDGEILKEADFYFEDPCFYFIFIEEDKPVKANMMTKEGVGFFNKMLSGISTQPIQQ